jgi:8-oxo-dGTP diphosphatase
MNSIRRNIRYQGAIIKYHHILLLHQRVFPSGRLVWLIPGGGREHGETEEECVKREMKEETNLDVRVVLLLEEAHKPKREIYYFGYKTYLCEVLGGEAKAGYDPEYNPEIEKAGLHGIIDVKWFDLRNESNWDDDLVNDPLIYIPLQRLRKKLGYLNSH